MQKDSKKAVAILWLHNMKAKGKTRQKALAEQYAAGTVSEHTLRQARKFQAAIDMLLAICTDCPMELDELHEMLKGIKPQPRAQNLFRKKNHNPI